MTLELPPECLEILTSQGKVIGRSQALESGLEWSAMRNRLRSGRWQKLHPGVYAAFTGEPAREAQLWAALLRAGPDATLSHYTAAERHGLLNGPSRLIHITVPADSNPARRTRIPGVVVHRSRSLLRTRHPAMRPPCTRVEDTVLDLIENAEGFDQAYDWICRAIGRRRTTAKRLREALNARERFRWRQDIERALCDAAAGMLSLLEHRYVYRVERPHGLPAARRQARVIQETGSRYLDNLYEEYAVCVELDGAAAHPADEQWRDKRRDRWNLVREKTVTLRFGFRDLLDQQSQCATAAEVATLLSDRGPAVGSPCRNPACPLGLTLVLPVGSRAGRG